MPAVYEGGTFTVPGSTGNYAVTGLSIDPAAVIFMGSNSATTGSVVTGDDLGQFIGFMTRNTSDTVVGYALSLLPEQGRYVSQNPIAMSASETGLAYSASAVSLDSGGFTVNFATVSSGVIGWLAFSVEEDAARAILQLGDSGGRTDTTVDVGFLAGALINLTARDLDFTGPDTAGGYHHVSYGGATINTYSGNMVGGFIAELNGGSNQHEVSQHSYDLPEGFIGYTADYIGPFMGTAWIYGYPTGASSFFYDMAGENSGAVLVWDSLGHTEEVTPNTTVSGTVDMPLNDTQYSSPSLWTISEASAATFFGVADSPSVPGGLSPCAIANIGFAVRNPDDTVVHYSCHVDGVASPKTLYQSTSKIVADVDGSNIAAFTVGFEGAPVGYITLTTTDNGMGGAIPSIIAHAYGGGAPVLPQLYRWWRAKDPYISN